MMVRFVVLCCFVTIPISVWTRECFHCLDIASRCKPGTNISTILECTDPTNRCFWRKVTGETREGDMIERGCTNEDGCDIMMKACENSGDCKTTCCHQDLCNSAVANGITSNTCTFLGLLVIILILRWEVS
ncbi:unnamed protein product [Pocillopora meandrina]|uniref:Uncharacterized protein n=1 Tax=Pocillopora meandrina TaxID=46732 RepID=A0AAU9W4P5_9CNID|nr:unnamed protein product [Pocillopora meandrina]